MMSVLWSGILSGQTPSKVRCLGTPLGCYSFYLGWPLIEGKRPVSHCVDMAHPSVGTIWFITCFAWQGGVLADTSTAAIS